MSGFEPRKALSWVTPASANTAPFHRLRPAVKLAEIKLPVSPELGRPEHHEWRWVSYDEAEDLLPPRLGIVLDWVRSTIG